MNRNRTLIIAEAGVNHNGSIELARRLIEVAAESGADIVKFQTFRADSIVTADAPKAQYQQVTTSHADSHLDILRKLELDLDAHLELIRYCSSCGIRFLSTPFDEGSVELLGGIGITLGKIPSGEVTNRPYLERMAATFPDLIMSTGMTTLEEIDEALQVLQDAGADRDRITLLHCTTEYPTPFVDVNLRAMGAMAERYRVPVGYSDHTLGIEVAIAAVAMGATIIEKHFTLDRTLPGPDHKASLEPGELKEMVRSIRNIEQALGDGYKRPSPSEEKNMAIARKSIILSRDKKAGEPITREDMEMKRPGDGISPMRMHEVIGRRLNADRPAGHRLGWEELS